MPPTAEAVDCLPGWEVQRDQAAINIVTNDARIAGATAGDTVSGSTTTASALTLPPGQTLSDGTWNRGQSGGAKLLALAGGSTGTGAATLDGTGSGNNGLQPAGIHGSVAGDGTIRGLVTVAGSGGFFTGGGKLINNFSTFSLMTGKLTLAAGLNMNGQTAAFNFYCSGTSNSSICIGDRLTLSRGDTVLLSGTPAVGIYHLLD